MSREKIIEKLWENSNHGTREEDVIAAFDAGIAFHLSEQPKLAHGHREDYYLMANTRRLINQSPKLRKMRNWHLAMNLFATGSNSAHQICIDAGIDPDAFEVQRN